MGNLKQSQAKNLKTIWSEPGQILNVQRKLPQHAFLPYTSAYQRTHAASLKEIPLGVVCACCYGGDASFHGTVPKILSNLYLFQQR